jgi:small-conductance mechanosensitive channel
MTREPSTIASEIANAWAVATGWLSSHSVQIGLALLVSAVIVGLLYGLKLFGQWLSRPRGHASHWPAIFGKALRRTKFWFMAATAAEIVRVFAKAPPEIATPIHALFIVAMGLQAAIWARAIVVGIIDHRAGETDPAGTLSSALGIIRLLVAVALFIVAGILILANLGVDVTGLLAGLGIGGIAIGLAAQGIFQDLFAALSILFDKPFRRGDVIRYDTTSGTVEYIGLKSSRIRAFSGEEIIISNANLLGKELRNFARLEVRRVNQLLSLVHHTPPETLARIEEILGPAVDGCEGAAFVRCGLDTFAPSSLDFILIYDIDAEDQALVLIRKNAVNIAVLRAFEAEGIAFAYPTQTTFTAAPDGTLVMPYAPPAGAT